MAVNFPDNPIVNDEFTSGTRTWIWDGTVWLLKQTLNVEVGNLNDVTLTNLANGDALLYNSTSQEWENGAVDVQGAIDTANAYTDSAVEDLTAYVDTYLDPSTGTTVEYIDQQDAATLAAANAYTDAEIAAIPPVDLTGYATEAYVDTAESDAVSTANAYTDAAIDSVVGLAPETLDTLAELAGAINNDPDFLSNIDALPDQAGNSGNYLTTDGTTASWSAIDIPSTTVSENAPAGAEEGDTWFRSSTGQYFVYYDSYWIEVGAGSDPDLSAYYTSTETDTAISAAINGLIDSAPSTLDTLNELAAALADDADFASTIVNQIGTLESTLQASIDQRKVEINQAVSSDVTLATGYRYFVDTSAARTLTLPLTPTLGDEIQLFDSVGTGSTNNVTINNNSEKINGVLDSAIIDIDGFATVFVYTGSTYGWRMI